MYTNIDTDHALQTIGSFFSHHQKLLSDLSLNGKMILEALDLVMRRNIFTFDDTA